MLSRPNISLYVEMPPCHRLYEIKRTFVMYSHLQRHGLLTVPFVSPENGAHASLYASWLRGNGCVTHVAASFQTIQRKKHVWRRHMRLLERIQSEVPRRLVWILIGQARNLRSCLDDESVPSRLVTVGPKFGRMRRPRALAPLPLR